MDRGFCEYTDNINALYKNHYKVPARSIDNTYAKDFIREISDAKDHFEFYDSDFDLYVFNKTIAWDYEQQRPYKR